MATNQPVVPRGAQWAVQGAGKQRATLLHPTQTTAIEAARSIVIRQQTELFIHRSNGQIRERNSYDGDPFPPRG